MWESILRWYFFYLCAGKRKALSCWLRKGGCWLTRRWLCRCTTKGEEDYRPLFENFVQDLLSTVNKPEWPSSELLLSLLGRILVRTQPFNTTSLSVWGCCISEGKIEEEYGKEKIEEEYGNQLIAITKHCLQTWCDFVKNLKTNLCEGCRASWWLLCRQV